MEFLTLINSLKFCIVMVGSSCLTFILIKYASIINILDIPNARSSHSHVIPRSGGIALFCTFLGSLLLFKIDQNYFFLFPLTIVFLLGLYDDIKFVSSQCKLVFLFIASIFLYLLNFDIQHFGVFLGHEIVLNFWIALLFFGVAVTGFVSALNLIDGLDGLASIVSIAILLPFAYMGFKYHDPFLFYITCSLVCTLLGFLIFNWHPAKIFMGDSGSLTLGFLIALVIVYAIKQSYITAISALFLAALPILDTLIVMLRRILNKQNPLHADKTHMHHLLLVQQGNNTQKTVLILGLTQILFSYLGLGFKLRDDAYIFLLYLICFIIFYMVLTPKLSAR